MKAVILAAGYATRMYPLTRDYPKPLLPLGETTILDLCLEQLLEVSQIDAVYVVANHRFFQQFEHWRCALCEEVRSKIELLDDGTMNNEERLGAIGDLALAIRRYRIADDLLCVAADTVFRFRVRDLVDFFEEKRASVIAVCEEEPEQLRRSGVVVLGEGNRVIDFQEKPQQPRSNLASPPLYIYVRDDVPLVEQYLDKGNNPDAPGHFIAWLHKHRPVYARNFPEGRVDVGSLETYQRLRAEMSRTT